MDALPKPPPLPEPFFRRNAISFKMAGILILALLLLIPLALIRSLISERQARRDEAVMDITSTWGHQQVVVGPVLIVPYEYKTKSWKEEVVNGKRERVEVLETLAANAFFLPSELSVAGQVDPSKLHRGIYEAIVYKSELAVSGRFSPPDFGALGIAPENVRWAQAQVTMAVSDLRGVGDVLTMKLGELTGEFVPGCRLTGYDSGITARFPGLQAGSNLSFQMTLDLKGSGGVQFAPVGQKTRVKMTSSWADPSFFGAFLPTDRMVGPKGFEASWEVSWYGRSYPQQTTDQTKGYAFSPEQVEPSLFGVNFLSGVDSYRMVERAAKYGILFIALIFTAFFLFEILSALSIHTVQYTLVGAALCLFYLALLSLSEFIRFGYAYWGGAVASSLLIVFYSLKVLGGGLRTLIIAVALAAIYTYLYVVLQMQDYSLLFGTAGLFVVLGIVMYATRNVDWSTRK